MNDLAHRRAERARDSKLWTPLDALEWLSEEILAGRIDPSQLVIWYRGKDDPDGGSILGHVVSGCGFPEHIALLNMALHEVLHDWKS